MNWKLPAVDVVVGSSAKADVDVVGVSQDGAKKPVAPKGPYASAVQKLKSQDVFSASCGSTSFIRFGGKKGAQNTLFVGLGSSTAHESFRKAGGSAWQKLTAEKSKSVSVSVDALFQNLKGSDEESVELFRAFAEGLLMGCYHFAKHKGPAAKELKYTGPAKVSFVTSKKNLKAALSKHAQEVRATVEAMNFTRDWSNEPSNIGTPEYFAAEAKILAEKYGLKCKIINDAEAKKERMDLYLAVGQGSEREGRIIVLEYNPKKATDGMKTLAYVGKGVTFDSGGISIKPSLKMEDMKHDMTGAATVLGAVLLAAKWQVPNRVIGFMAFTENMPDGNALQPGNVITTRAGKTVEVINTDAEGRLVLADVLDYAQDFKPDLVIDVATLTGAVAIALGKQCCAVLGDSDLSQELISVGGEHGERIWELPMWDEYFDDLKSDTAEMKNSANDSYGGTIRGAIFLKQFIRKGTRWAHLDIAATAYNLSHLPYYPKKGASGAYVRTLAEFARKVK